MKNKQYNKALKCYSVAKTYGNISNKNKLCAHADLGQ